MPLTPTASKITWSSLKNQPGEAARLLQSLLCHTVERPRTTGGPTTGQTSMLPNTNQLSFDALFDNTDTARTFQ
jgi:hypothetical protein